MRGVRVWEKMPILFEKEYQDVGQSEYAEQAELIKWARARGGKIKCLLFLHSSLNGEALTKGQRIKAIRGGLLSGVPDLFLPYPSGSFHGLFIEMKTRQGRQSIKQRAFQEYVESVSYKYILTRAWHEARDSIIEYLYGR